MLRDDIVWELHREGDGPSDDTVPRDPAPTHSFRPEDVRLMINVPLSDVEEFFALTAGNNYDEIVRRWGQASS